MDLDFLDYIQKKKTPRSGRQEKTGFGEYAFAGDIRVLRQLDRARPVRLVAESSVRFWNAFEKSDLMGSGVKLGRRQFPGLYNMVVECADTLDIAPPSVYLQQTPAMAAYTYGTDQEAFVVLTSSLVDRLDDAELKFVIGHECGHLQNNHVVYATAGEFLKQGIGSVVRVAVVPATVALNAWSRRGEITCDRAGMLCARDERAAINTMLKLALGSKQLFESIDLDEYLQQLDHVREGIGRVREYFSSHPYLPKRIKALRLFAESAYYREHVGERGGRALDEIDREVEEIIKVM